MIQVHTYAHMYVYIYMRILMLGTVPILLVNIAFLGASWENPETSFADFLWGG